MGDMKTPDFDDLLAAFDIPDATGLDAKEPIQESHEEIEKRLKHTVMCLDDSLLGHPAVTTDVPLVSVIVKNTSRTESLDGVEDGFHSGLHNGFRGTCGNHMEPHNISHTEAFEPDANREPVVETLSPLPLKSDGSADFPQSHLDLSPVTCLKTEDKLCDKEKILSLKESPCLLEDSVEASFLQHPDLISKHACKDTRGTPASETFRSKKVSETQNSCETGATTKVLNTFPILHRKDNFIETNCRKEKKGNDDSSFSLSEPQTPKSLFAEAPEAPGVRKDPTYDISEPSVALNDCKRPNHKVPLCPVSPRSPLEAVKRLLRPPDSPASICSDSSGKASPAVVSGSPGAIPRVRIKTIKTICGQIRRTVTSVLPDSETDDIHSAYESSPSRSTISEDSYYSVSPYHSQMDDCVSGIQSQSNSAIFSPRTPHRPPEDNSQSSAAALHSGAFKPSASHKVRKMKRASSAAALTANSSFLPKAMHLASLNLVPHSVAASVAARPPPHQQDQHVLPPTVCSSVPLVHQVKAVSPFPRLPPPNTAAATLSRLLSNSNPVPTYVPNLHPPPESNISLPPRGYSCLECGDSFGVERSLTSHYSRRSVHIEVGCLHCTKTMVFFNKCALLAHAREHKNKGVVMQCTQLHMKPISESQMFVPLNAETAKTQAASSLASSKSEPVLPLYPDDAVHRRLRCVECKKRLPDYKALTVHYQKTSANVEGLICKVCTMLLPNKCSLRAHRRIHEHKSPHCCPECGAQCRPADIQKHVRENCLHYARKAWYKCLHCDMVFRTLQGQKTHIEEKHCEVFFKCSVCPVAFKSSAECEVHLKKKHKGIQKSHERVFKCSCQAVFKRKQSVFQHFQQNASRRVTCVFKCPECNAVFPQKRLLMHHFKDVHVGNMTTETENDTKDSVGKHSDLPPIKQQKSRDSRQNMDRPRQKCERDSRPEQKPRGWTCGECLQRFAERESYVSHVKTKHGKSMKKYPCRHCEQSFHTAVSLRRHTRTEHDGKRRIYSCWYCTETKKIFTTSVMLKNHISLMHGVKNPDLSQMPKMSLEEYKETFGKELITGTPAVDMSVHSQDQRVFEAPAAKQFRSQYRCSKCGFLTDDSMDFQQHIPQHKTDANTPQCLHCGLCFTSLCSLKRHLFIVHKVKDPREEEQLSLPVPSVGAEQVKVLEPERPHCSTSTDLSSDMLLHTETASLQP